MSPYHPNPYYSPEPLPVEPKLELSDQTYDLVADAAYQIGRVDGISSTVDFSAVLYTSFIRIEAVESARIEGADVAYQDVEAYHTKHSAGEASTTIEKDLKEAPSITRLHSRTGLDRIESGASITLSLLTELHSMLLEDVRTRVTSSVTSATIWFISRAHSRDSVRSSHRLRRDSLDSWPHLSRTFRWVDSTIPSSMPPSSTISLRQSTLSDGNGRLGRLLIILYLASEGYLESPYIYPSAYFNRHKVEYVERMRAVSEDGGNGMSGSRSSSKDSEVKLRRRTTVLTDSEISKSATTMSTLAARKRTRSLGSCSSIRILEHQTSWSISTSHAGLPTRSSTTSNRMVSLRK